jgi:hypothetical protein
MAPTIFTEVVPGNPSKERILGFAFSCVPLFAVSAVVGPYLLKISQEKAMLKWWLYPLISTAFCIAYICFLWLCFHFDIDVRTIVALD